MYKLTRIINSSIQGTERYLAPELVLSEDIVKPTTHSDVYAIGCVGLEVWFPVKSRHDLTLRSLSYANCHMNIRRTTDNAL
jgi:serine/threonine protein kinase